MPVAWRRRKQIGWMFDGRAPGWERALAGLVNEGAAIPATVGDLKGPWFVHADLLDRPFRPRTTLLSPFDDLVSDRDHTERLFGFRFRLEIYVPKAKREFGYFVLPILHGDRLIGRIDPRFDRATEVLDVNAVYAQEGAPADAGAAVRRSIDGLAAWLGARDVRFTQKVPASWRSRSDLRSLRPRRVGTWAFTTLPDRTPSSKGRCIDMPKGILERLAEGPVLGDGGYLLELEKRGYVQAGPFTPEVVIEHPDALEQLHREFLRAGVDVLQTMTFYASDDKLATVGLAGKVDDINRNAVQIARKVAAEGDALVAGNLCLTWAYEPDDPASADHVRALFDRQLQDQLDAGGVDFWIGETFSLPRRGARCSSSGRRPPGCR